MAITLAPASTANCTAIRPTPPDAPWTTTVSPAPTPVIVNACTAVDPVSIRPLACSKVSVDGVGTTLETGTTTWEA